MHSIKSLFRLELKARFGHKGVKFSSVAIKFSLIGLFAAVIYAIYIFGLQNFISMFHLYELDYEFIQMFITLAQVILIAFGVSSVIKTLYYSGDNELLLRFPVSGEAVFIAKISILVMYQAIYTLLVMLPVFIMFGITVNAPLNYYLLIPVIMLISIVFPLCLANILAIPTMYLNSRIKNKYLATLITSVIAVACGFALYMGAIQSIIGFMKDEAMRFFSPQTFDFLTRALNYVVPFRWFADIMTGRNMLLSLPLTLVSVLLALWGAILVVRKMYLYTVVKALEASGNAFRKVTKNKHRHPIISVFRREFLEIFRSTNYSFQYLCMAVAAPVMVYFCNKIASSLGERSIGVVILPALTLLVILIFVAIILSFAGSCVSREGENFYLTKISPVSVKLQIFVKLALYLIVAFISIAVTTAVVIITKQVTVGMGFAIMGIAVMIAIAITCMAVKMDIMKPQFAVGGDGELINGNASIFIALVVGFAISVLFGIFGMVGIFLWGIPFTFGMIAAASFLFMSGMIIWLLVKLGPAYERIMQR